MRDGRERGGRGRGRGRKRKVSRDRERGKEEERTEKHSRTLFPSLIVSFPSPQKRERELTH